MKAETQVRRAAAPIKTVSVLREMPSNVRYEITVRLLFQAFEISCRSCRCPFSALEEALYDALPSSDFIWHLGHDIIQGLIERDATSLKHLQEVRSASTDLSESLNEALLATSAEILDLRAAIDVWEDV